MTTGTVRRELAVPAGAGGTVAAARCPESVAAGPGWGGLLGFVDAGIQHWLLWDCNPLLAASPPE